MAKLRNCIGGIILNKAFTRFVTFLILLNAVTLGLETDPGISAKYGPLLFTIDHVILGLFVVELLMRLFVHRMRFFRDGWNVFDFIIIIVSLLPAVEFFSALRTFRIFRVLRLMSVVPKMRRVITALFSAMPGMASVMAVLLVIFYVAAVFTTHVFGVSQDPKIHALFGDIGNSMFTLFQLMTLEGWVADVAQPVMAVYPHSWIFFVLFIIVTSFAVLNLFIGIIVDALNILHDQEDADGSERHHSEEMQVLMDIKQQLSHLADEVETMKRR